MVKKLSLLLLLTGCATGYRPDTKVSAEELRPHVLEFERLYDVKVNTPYYFADLYGNAVGMCRVWVTGKTEIVIDTDYYAKHKDNYLDIEELMFHELGHCVFRRDHNETMLENRPESIMYPYVFGYMWYYKAYRDLYIDELRDITNQVLMKAPYMEFID